MQKLDFSSLRTQYSLLTDEDVGFLNQFFNAPETQTILKETEKTRKKYVFFSPMLALILIAAMFAIFWFFPQFTGFIFWILPFAIAALYAFVTKTVTLKVKEKLLAKMMREISKKISYSGQSTYFKDSLQQIISETKLLKPYDRMDFMEDSLEMIDKKTGITVTGVEVKTSTQQTNSKGHTTYTTNNHCYLMKIKFHNPKYTIKNAITLLPDGWKMRYILPVIILCIVFISIFVVLFGDISTGFSIIQNFNQFEAGQIVTASEVESLTQVQISRGKIYFFLIVLVFWSTGIFTIYTWFKNKKRLVRLENADFEKKFEVYCDDQIESRKVLTPDFMYRIYDYANKIDKNRKYSLYFKDDYIYIKFDVSSHFLEISAFKSLLKNLTQYVEFYLEMKNISALADDLKLGFYDKNFSRKQVIK